MTPRELRGELTSLVVGMMLDVPGVPLGARMELEAVQRGVHEWGDEKGPRVAYALRSAWAEANEAVGGGELDRLVEAVLAASNSWLLGVEGAWEGPESARMAAQLWSLACVVSSWGKGGAAVRVLSSAGCPNGLEAAMELCRAGEIAVGECCVRS